MNNMFLKASFFTLLIQCILVMNATAQSSLSMTVDAVTPNLDRHHVTVTFYSNHTSDYELDIGLNDTYLPTATQSLSYNQYGLNERTYIFVIDQSDYLMDPKRGAVIVVNCRTTVEPGGQQRSSNDLLFEDSCIVTIGP